MKVLKFLVSAIVVLALVGVVGFFFLGQSSQSRFSQLLVGGSRHSTWKTAWHRQPAFIAQERGDPAVAAATIFLSQRDDRREWPLIYRRCGLIALGRAVLTNEPTGTALGYIQHLLHMIDGQPTP